MVNSHATDFQCVGDLPFIIYHSIIIHLAMKKILFVVFAFTLFSLTAAQAQVRFGLRAGLSSDNLGKKTLNTADGSIGIKDARYGYHIGAFARVGVSKFYIQPELLFNSSKVDFELNGFSEGLANTVLHEKYRNLDIPVGIGYKTGILRLQVAPVGHVHLSTKSELDDLDEFDEDFKTLTLGWQAGLGLDLWKVIIDLKYEGNFSKFGNHLMVGGEELDFDTSPSRLILSAGISF